MTGGRIKKKKVNVCGQFSIDTSYQYYKVAMRIFSLLQVRNLCLINVNNLQGPQLERGRTRF